MNMEKNRMISILLAEAVLEQQGRINEIKPSGNDVYIYGKNGENIGLYNIYELTHKCKEWAMLQDFYEIFSSSTGYCYCLYNSRLVFETTEDTEQEAIFKACQWILENR